MRALPARLSRWHVGCDAAAGREPKSLADSKSRRALGMGPSQPCHQQESHMNKTNAGVKVRTNLKAGRMYIQHNRAVGLRVRAGVKAGGRTIQLKRAALAA